MRKTPILLTMIGFFGLLSAISASENEILSFDQCLNMVLNQNLQIKISRYEAEIAERNAHIGNAGLLPRVDFSSGFDHQENRSTTSAQIQASLTLFSGLGNIFRWKRLQVSERLGRLESRNQTELVLLEASAAYFSAASAYEQLIIAREMVDISRQRLDRAKKRSAFGRATTIDVLAAQVDHASDQVTLTQARYYWDQARRNLNILLNRPIETKFTVDTRVKFRKDYDIETLKTNAYNNNARFLAEFERLKQSELDLKIANAAFYPQLDMSASYGITQGTEGWGLSLSNPAETLRIGINLSQNLFNGFNNRVARTIAKIQLKNQQLNIDETRLNLEKKVTTAFESHKNSLQVLDLEKKVVAAAEVNFKRTRELYNLGQVTTTQFREAQINLIRSRSDLSSAKYQAKLNEIELLQLTGQLSPRKLTLSGR